MDPWKPLGRHRYKIADGILWFETHGEFTLAELTEYVAIYEQLLSAHPTFGILADVSQGLSISPAVRKHASQVLQPLSRQVPIAVYGANLAIRTIFSLFTNAQRILYGTQPNSAFFSTARQARSWLEEKISQRRSP